MTDMTPTPFVVEHRPERESPVSFTPRARLILAPARLRETGLLRALTDEAARTLLAVISYLTDNGYLHPTVAQVAEALGVSERRAGERLQRLSEMTWQEAPLLWRLARENGLDAYVPSAKVVGEGTPPPDDGEVVPLPLPPPSPSHREAILAHSRATYGRPREEVERIVAEQLGHTVEETLDTPEGAIRRQLLALGVSRDEVEELIAYYPLDAIQEQIAWLPERGANHPGRFLVAAIRGAYAPPARARLERAVQEEQHEEQETQQDAGEEAGPQGETEETEETEEMEEMEATEGNP
jgi:hypothetical protein